MIILKVLFKNTTKYSENVYTEFLEFHKNKFHISYTFYTAIVLIALFYCISMQVIYHNYTLAIFLCIILSAFFLWRFLHPIKEVKRDFNSPQIQKQKVFSFLFFDNSFKIRNNIRYEIIKYSSLYRMFETDNYFYFYIDKSHSYIISKSGFTKGSASDFSNFIRKKFWWKYKNNCHCR